MKHILSFSGGKDSTALLLMMLEKNMPIDEIIFCDTGVEFPEMLEHIKKVEVYIGRKITTVRNKHSYEYYLGSYVKQNGEGIGFGHPDFKNRWCTYYMKKKPYFDYLKVKYPKEHIVEYLGIAYDEKYRTKEKSNRDIKYPLVDWQIFEYDALEYCYKQGFDWDGLYEKMPRVSCWCCPLSRLEGIKMLYEERPELWAKLKEFDTKSFRRFRYDYTIDELEQKFEWEKKNKGKWKGRNGKK